MALADLGAFLDDDVLEVPVAGTVHPDGRTYRIPSPDAETGLRLTALANLGAAVAVGREVNAADVDALRMNDDDEREFLEQILGSAYGELIADKVSWVRIQRLGRYAFVYFAMGPEAAQEYVNRAMSSGGSAVPSREQRRAARKTSSSPASSATAKPTRSQGSTAGTTARSGTKPRKRA